MKAAFDLISTGSGFKDAKNHGGGEYTKTVFDYCARRYKGQIHVVTTDDKDIQSFLKNYQNIIIHKCSSSKEYNILLNREGFDVVYCGLIDSQYDNVSFPKKTQFIFTEHGLRGVEVKFDSVFIKTERKKLRNRIKKFLSIIAPRFYLKLKLGFYKREIAITTNYKLVTVSYHSKYAINNFLPEVKDIFVGYSPMKVTANQTDDSLIKRYNLEKGKYILMISASRGEKNCLRGIEAVSQLMKENKIPSDFKVVLTGVTYKKPFKKYSNGKTILLGYIDSMLLETLYKNAFLFLYPSINEGFGYPPLEAMKYHTLVATSAITSIPEVCGDSVLYFNPYDVNEIKNRIMQSFDIDIRERHINQIDERLSYISKKQEEGLAGLYNLIFGDNND